MFIKGTSSPNCTQPIKGSDRDQFSVASKTKVLPVTVPLLNCMTASYASKSLLCQLLDMTEALLYFNNYKASWPLTNKWEDLHVWAELASVWPCPLPTSVLPNLCLCGAEGDQILLSYSSLEVLHDQI